MKKYFAKYLPVEGKIKEGDLCIGEDEGGLRIHECKKISYCEKIGCKKVKLFLCSRDIQVGDEYYNEQFEFTKYPNKSIADSSTEMVGENGSYKVIGEISPDAVWVKEGDKFDEDEVKESYIITNDKRSSSYNLHWYRIKCPTCKTFH